MGGNRSARSAKQLPTKEIFVPVIQENNGAWEFQSGFGGVVIDADDEQGFITLLVPHDFSKLEDLRIVFIPQVALAEMTLNVLASYAYVGQIFSANDKELAKTVLTGDNNIQELDITDTVDVLPLKPNQYLGIRIRRVSGQNTDINLLGVRLKYTARTK